MYGNSECYARSLGSRIIANKELLQFSFACRISPKVRQPRHRQYLFVSHLIHTLFPLPFNNTLGHHGVQDSGDSILVLYGPVILLFSFTPNCGQSLEELCNTLKACLTEEKARGILFLYTRSCMLKSDKACIPREDPFVNKNSSFAEWVQSYVGIRNARMRMWRVRVPRQSSRRKDGPLWSCYQDLRRIL